MTKIKNIFAREILDSRGVPTVKAIVQLDNGQVADAAVASGASTGTHEAVELRDNDPKRYHGKGVLKAIEKVEKIIAPKVVGLDPSRQKEIDNLMIELDGTNNKSSLGANSILAVSLACARVAAYSNKISLVDYISNLYTGYKKNRIPRPMLNVINGGLHGGNNLSIQEFLLIPQSKNSFSDTLRMGVEIYQTLKNILKSRRLSVAVGDEGGFAPQLASDAQALALLHEAIDKSGYEYLQDVTLGLDLAASTYFKNGKYKLTGYDHELDSREYMQEIINLHKKFNLASLEDVFAEDEWESWTDITSLLGKETLIIGDDLLVTNPKRVKTAIEKKACNAILVKLNQIGTLTETLEVIKQARNAGFRIIISHRSGETEDHFIADLSVAVGADFVKFGAPARGERVVKYNRLLELTK